MNDAPDPFDLSGRTALVTGSTRGIGQALALSLARAGARIIVNGRDASAAAGCADHFASMGFDALPCAFDITSESSVDGALEDLLAKTGGVDILVNNAGFNFRRELLEIELSDFQGMLDVNLTGALLTARRLVPGMIERGGGKVINICSLMSLLARKTTGAYTAAKGGLKMLTQAMCAEWAEHNVQVNGIAPGYILTDLTRPLAKDPDFNAWITGRTPAGRWAEVEELGGTAVFLASSASDFVNGQMIVVDGGLSAVI